jgi:LacI family transcriptional regulator
VRAAAEALGYTPDPTARSLRTRRSGLVGVVLPDLTNPVLPAIVRAIEETLWRRGLAVLLADTDNDPAREGEVVDQLVARRCEGLVVATATRTSDTVRALARGDVPAVLVTRDVEGVDLPFVGADDAAGVAAAVRHLVDLGHERIACLTGPLELSTTVTRVRAFHAALAELRPGTEPLVRHGESFTIPTGRRLAEALLAEGHDVTAILAGNDMIALGVYEALSAAGVRCPDDISVVGHNDMPLVGSVSPPLTTVAIPKHRIGVEAASLLLDRLDGRGAGDERRLLDTRLVVRASTAPAPAGSRHI